MTPLFGPGWGNYAIQGIVEISVPAHEPFVPATPAWWFLGASILLATLAFARKRYRVYRRNAYRRLALEDLRVLRARASSGDSGALGDLAVLLRRVVLNCGPRERFAGLQGRAWQQAVDALAPALPPLPTARLHRLAYAPQPETPDDRDALFDALERWIREHRVPDA